MRTIEYGKPAEWAAQQKWKRRGSAVKSYGSALLIGLGVAAIVALLVYTNFLPTWVAIVVAAVAAAAGGAFMYMHHKSARQSLKRAGYADIGVQSERQVRKIVRRNKPVAAVYGAVLGKRQGDIDLILVDRGLCLASVEIKTGFGKVSIDGNQVRAGRKVMPRDPLGQCQKEARRVASAAGVSAMPVLCIPGMTNKAFMHDDILVTPAKDLFKALRAAGTRSFSSQEEAEATVQNLWKRHKQMAA